MRIMFFLWMLLNVLPANAQRVVTGDIFPGVAHTKNYVLNGEIEQSKNSITDASGIATRSTSSPLSGAASLLIDGTANAQKVIFAAAAREPVLYGQTCVASFIYNGDASLYTASVAQGGTDVAGTVTTLSNAGTSAVTVSIPFSCGVGATGANTLVITCTSASCAAIKVDKVYMGLASSPTTSTTASPTRRTTAVSTSVLLADGEIYVTAASTITLLAANTVGAKPVRIVNAIVGGGTVTITRSGSDTIMGETSQFLLNQYDNVLMIPDGTSTYYMGL